MFQYLGEIRYMKILIGSGRGLIEKLRGRDAVSWEAILSNWFLSPFWKGVYSKKEFATHWSKFFPFLEKPFSEGA